MAGLATITEAEYDTWLPPRIVLEHLKPLIRQDAIAAISMRFLSDSVRMAAYKITIIADDKSDLKYRYTIISNKLMSSIELRDSFWSTSDLTVYPDQLCGVDYNHIRVPGRSPTIILVGVRFDPADIDRIVDHAGIRPRVESLAQSSTAVPEPDERKTISAGDRHRIAEVIAQVFGNDITEVRAHKIAAESFSDKKVPRDPFLEDFRAIRGKQLPGKKRQTEI